MQNPSFFINRIHYKLQQHNKTKPDPYTYTYMCVCVYSNICMSVYVFHCIENLQLRVSVDLCIFLVKRNRANMIILTTGVLQAFEIYLHKNINHRTNRNDNEPE